LRLTLLAWLEALGAEFGDEIIGMKRFKALHLEHVFDVEQFTEVVVPDLLKTLRPQRLQLA